MTWCVDCGRSGLRFRETDPLDEACRYCGGDVMVCHYATLRQAQTALDEHRKQNRSSYPPPLSPGLPIKSHYVNFSSASNSFLFNILMKSEASDRLARDSRPQHLWVILEKACLARGARLLSPGGCRHPYSARQARRHRQPPTKPAAPPRPRTTGQAGPAKKTTRAMTKTPWSPGPVFNLSLIEG